MPWLKQSTPEAVLVGPFVDPADGVTELTSLTPVARLSKAGGAWSDRSSSDPIAHTEDGWYSVPLDANDLNTLGSLRIKFSDPATYLPVWGVFDVMAERSYAPAPTASSIRSEIDSNSTKLDAAITTRLAAASYSAPPSTSAIAAAVWANATRTLTSFGSLVSDIWSNITRTLTSAGAGGATAEEVWEYADRTVRLVQETPSIVLVPITTAHDDLNLIRGDTYTDEIDRAITFTDGGNWPTLTNAVVTFTIQEIGASTPAISVSGVVSGSTVTVELTSANTNTLRVSTNRFKYKLTAVLPSPGSEVVTLAHGEVNVS